MKRKQKLEKRVGDPQKFFGNFENLKYDSTENSGDILVDNSCDPDLYFFQTNFHNLHTPYIFPEEFHQFLVDESTAIDSFKLFLSYLNFNISIICFFFLKQEFEMQTIQNMN